MKLSGSSLDLGWIESGKVEKGALSISRMSVFCDTKTAGVFLTMSAVAEILGTIIEKTGRAAAGSHSLKIATLRSQMRKKRPHLCITMNPNTLIVKKKKTGKKGM